MQKAWVILHAKSKSNKPVTKENTAWAHSYELSKIAEFIESKSRIGGRGGGNWKQLINRHSN